MVHSNINDKPVKSAGAGRAHMMTKGGYRVGLDFNPSGNRDVEAIKTIAAAFIDMIESIEVPANIPEAGRLKALAQTAIEEGQMWAVKAITKQPFPSPPEPALRKVPAVDEPTGAPV
jgi:hypothetical protein